MNLFCRLKKKHCNQGKGKCSKQQMEGANHCYEIKMTSNYLLAANVHVCQLLCHVPPLSFFLLCLFVVVAMMNLSGRSEMQPSPLFLNVETEKIGVVKQSLCHIENGSCLQWVISGAFYKLTAFSSEAQRTAGFQMWAFEN